MTALLVLCDALLSIGAGAVIAEAAGLRLRLIERALVAVAVALVLAPAATYAIALLVGLGTGAVLLGPALLLIAGAVLLALRRDPLRCWRRELPDALGAWRRRPPWGMLAVTAFAAAVFGVLFGHTLYTQDGALVAGFQTVWADWSQHLSTEASFAVGGNVAGGNPLFAGTPLLYPFVADLQSAGLAVLGMAPQAALAAPSGLLALVAVLLVIRLAARLGLGMGAGVIAAAVTFVGGGLGFVGVFADACRRAGSSAVQCTASHVFASPGDGARVLAGTLRALPGVLAAQGRAYDGLLTAPAQQPLPDMQWYTPLFAWWLPQRTLLYGFVAALAVLLLVLTALRAAERSWAAFSVAGILVGVLPIVHVQTFIALAIFLVVLALFHRRREWAALAGAALLLAVPRLVQLALSPHGSPTFANAYPWLEPGWLSGALTPSPAPTPLQASAVVPALGHAIRALATGQWWGFWLANLGVALPVCLGVAALAGVALAGGGAAAWARSLVRPFSRPLLVLLLAALLVFALCNVLVPQSWDWDNTKLLVYWYLVASLIIGALAMRMVRRGLWQGAGGVLMVAVTLCTGVVVLLRLLPWTPVVDSVGGPYTLASADERALASTLVTRTSPHDVFLTYGRPNDPVLILAGRTTLMAYYGWLWSYGIDFGNRYADVRAMYRGCSQASTCTVYTLLREYHVSYVEIDDRTGSPGGVEPNASPAWWEEQHLPVVARSEHVVVYDVRRL